MKQTSSIFNFKKNLTIIIAAIFLVTIQCNDLEGQSLLKKSQLESKKIKKRGVFMVKPNNSNKHQN